MTSLTKQISKVLLYGYEGRSAAKVPVSPSLGSRLMKLIENLVVKTSSLSNPQVAKILAPASVQKSERNHLSVIKQLECCTSINVPGRSNKNISELSKNLNKFV